MFSEREREREVETESTNLGKRSHGVHEPLDENVALPVHQLVHHPDQVGQALIDGSSKHSTVQVLGGTLNLKITRSPLLKDLTPCQLSSPSPPLKYLDKEVADAPEPISETGLVLAEPVIVGDAAVVHLLHELSVLPVHQHLVQPLAAAFLHPLEAELEVDRQL